MAINEKCKSIRANSIFYVAKHHPSFVSGPHENAGRHTLKDHDIYLDENAQVFPICTYLYGQGEEMGRQSIYFFLETMISNFN